MALRYLVCLMFATFTLDAQIYNVSQDALLKENNQTKDQFFYGDFKEINRFEALVFNTEGNLTHKSQNDFEEIAKKLQDAKADEVEYLLTVIGHYEKPTDNYYEQIAESNAWGRELYRLFEEETSSQTSFEQSKKYALDIKQRLIDKKIDEKLITVEFRSGEDSAYSNETQESKELSNRVLITMYVKHPREKDSDQDGVFDSRDKCSNTPLNVKVDVYGCSLDSDHDGVVDYVDQCPNTLQGVSVDEKGCPLDTDQDGVPNYKDKCPNTLKSFEVDVNGCPLKETLGLHFERDSSKILRDSYGKIVQFATFLKRNPLYDVTITGHTDSRGSMAKNMKLSQDRAEATKQALINEGVDASRITTAGKGELSPIASNRTPEGRQLNRRIEIRLTQKEEGLNGK